MNLLNPQIRIVHQKSKADNMKVMELTRVSSRVATRMYLPLGENLAKEMAGPLSSMSVFKRAPVSEAQILQEPS